MARNAIGSLSADKLRELARVGTELALKNLRAEVIAIEGTFPELKQARTRQAVRQTVNQAAKRRHRISAAGRRAVSERMKRYWAERRKAQAKVK